LLTAAVRLGAILRSCDLAAQRGREIGGWLKALN
jgi:hypothetical protein